MSQARSAEALDAWVATTQRNLEPGRAPAWNFADDRHDAPRDASAGAIAADGLIDLGTPKREAQGRTLLDVLLDTCMPVAGSEEEGRFRLADPDGSAVLIQVIVTIML